ncbi:glutathione peroxidase [Sphingomonas nostoxanthinifaciens]|uniref:glutathione peroxidase n=1 Tax=Sphingomonas nostoxanthinifaciens TaxID=2872652 RepID=UPI001CC1C2B9|nr:glutathione peroxidase [Sphingomonas nostoxanthinifaciens]UAK25365.1 glutathione peroxidase [Sphingomonas nostoxanthinifaciens]
MTDIQNVPVKTLAGKDSSLSDYDGQVLLVVNVASKCGLTPQYEGLQALYEKYKDEGFVILGFPSNDFAGQEPGSEEEIADFCSTNYGVTFPMFSKIAVVGPDKHPLYRELVSAAPVAANTGAFRAKLSGYGMTPNPEPEVLWNFEKFLVGRDGEVASRFSPDTAPDDDALIQAIERELFASE